MLYSWLKYRVQHRVYFLVRVFVEHRAGQGFQPLHQSSPASIQQRRLDRRRDVRRLLPSLTPYFPIVEYNYKLNISPTAITNTTSLTYTDLVWQHKLYNDVLQHRVSRPWLTRDYHVTITWLTRDQHVTNSWLTRGCHETIISWLPSCHHVAITSLHEFYNAACSSGDDYVKIL